MSGLFQALEIGKRALSAQQYSLQTTGHNIANVNTPGYTRQRVTISPSYPGFSAAGPIGTGIQVDDIRQVRDLFLGDQYREAQKSLGQWTYKEKTLGYMESIFNEPSDNGLGSQLNQFWDSWSELATDSASVTSRKNVLSNAQTLANSLNQTARQLDNQRTSIDSELKTITAEINSYTSEIARLNEQIIANEVTGAKANDLRDARDLLIDELSNVIDVRTVEKGNGGNIVYMGAMMLVDGSDAMNIGTKTVNKSGATSSKLVWEGTDVELTNVDGQLRGLLESRDEIIPGYLAELDELARTLVQEVNALHSSGYGLDGSTGVNFFDPTTTTAATIRINPELEGDGARKIVAAGAIDSPGDNSIALALSDLRDSAVAANGSMSIDEFYNSLVGKLGVETQEAFSFSNNYSLMIEQVDNARQSVQGVSLDEETANLVKFQHAYDAAARVITTMDQALDTVISGMGIVGR